jgi:hypothetical protein
MLQQTQTATLEDITERLQRENLRALWISRGLFLLALVSFYYWCQLAAPVKFYRSFSPLWFFIVPVLLAGLHQEGYRSGRRRRILEEAIVPLGLFQERAGLGTLLRFRRTLVFTTDEECKLQALCVNPLHKLAPRATVDELERLGKEERKELVSLLTITLGPHFVRTRLMGASKEPNGKNIEFGIALFLALTTLKEPGGEKSARLVLKRYSDERLREAAKEYLSALR